MLKLSSISNDPTFFICNDEGHQDRGNFIALIQYAEEMSVEMGERMFVKEGNKIIAFARRGILTLTDHCSEEYREQLKARDEARKAYELECAETGTESDHK
jgi:hypothetical protein